jgi:hypothetical protein
MQALSTASRSAPPIFSDAFPAIPGISGGNSDPLLGYMQQLQQQQQQQDPRPRRDSAPQTLTHQACTASATVRSKLRSLLPFCSSS